jgi:hypothetical protein
MAIKPILFNTEMVRAILDGRKTCTRRVVKPQWEECPICKYVHNEYIYDNMAENVYCARCGYPMEPERRSPYQPGDILYVRETVWQKIGYYLDVDGETKPSWYNEFRYVASDEKPETGWNYSWVKRPSIHMPKEATRIWLKVTDVRVERLQDITADGIRNEGLSSAAVHCGDVEIALKEWENLWNSTIKKADLDCYGWGANPWVWVIEFERCEKPEGV